MCYDVQSFDGVSEMHQLLGRILSVIAKPSSIVDVMRNESVGVYSGTVDLKQTCEIIRSDSVASTPK
jgi:hypothetical protein